jgi:predicted nucleotidyltransferase
VKFKKLPHLPTLQSAGNTESAGRNGNFSSMVTQQDALAVVQDFITQIRAKGILLKKAILFGSYARNTQQEWSDIDLALVADEFTGVGYYDLSQFVDIKVSDDKFMPIETHTFSSDYFEQGDPFVEEIIRTGIVLN